MGARSDLWQTNWPINPRKLVRCSLPGSIPGRTGWRTLLRKCRRTGCWGGQPLPGILRSACCAPSKEVCFLRKLSAVKSRSRLHSTWRSITWRATADHQWVHPTPAGGSERRRCDGVTPVNFRIAVAYAAVRGYRAHHRRSTGVATTQLGLRHSPPCSPHPHMAAPQIQHHPARANTAHVRGDDHHSPGLKHLFSLDHVSARHIQTRLGDCG